MNENAADLDRMDQALVTCDFSDEALEAAARVDGRPAITVGYCATASTLGTACRIEQRND
jgi:hypothetical protein